MPATLLRHHHRNVPTMPATPLRHHHHNVPIMRATRTQRRRDTGRGHGPLLQNPVNPRNRRARCSCSNIHSLWRNGRASIGDGRA